MEWIPTGAPSRVPQPNRNIRRGTRYHETVAKTIVNPVKGMPFSWSISPYRGCVHACTYCYARASHAFLGYDTGEDFEKEIVVKVNAAELLRGEIRHPKLRQQQMIMGTISDPYQPAEHAYRLTRKILGILDSAGNPTSITTKSTTVTQDLPLLAGMAERAGCSVNVTITTPNEDLARLLEPRAPSPRQRLRALQVLAEAGIPTGIFCAPILPGLTDTEDDLERLAELVAMHGGRWMMGSALRIGQDFAKPFLAAAQRDFPHLVARYERQARRGYRGSVSRNEADEIHGRMDEIRARYGLLSGPPSLPKPLVEQQATLALGIPS
jgi:DNA repair photolyase